MFKYCITTWVCRLLCSFQRSAALWQHQGKVWKCVWVCVSHWSNITHASEPLQVTVPISRSESTILALPHEKRRKNPKRKQKNWLWIRPLWKDESQRKDIKKLKQANKQMCGICQRGLAQSRAGLAKKLPICWGEMTIYNTIWYNIIV